MWKLEILGETFTELDCSPLLAERVEDACGLRWNGVGVAMSRGEVKAIRRVGAALVADRLGLNLDDAASKIDEAYTGRLDELIAAVTAVDDDLPTAFQNGFPHTADETSTSG